MRGTVIGLLLALGIIAGGSFVPARVPDPLSSHRELKVATNSGWLPQSFLDEHNQLVGFDIDVAREIAHRLGTKVSFGFGVKLLFFSGDEDLFLLGL